jgi:hypothetical protein
MTCSELCITTWKRTREYSFSPNTANFRIWWRWVVSFGSCPLYLRAILLGGCINSWANLHSVETRKRLSEEIKLFNKPTAKIKGSHKVTKKSIIFRNLTPCSLVLLSLTWSKTRQSKNRAQRIILLSHFGVLRLWFGGFMGFLTLSKQMLGQYLKPARPVPSTFFRESLILLSYFTV